MRDQIEARAVIVMAGIDWKVLAEAEIDGNEYLMPVEVEIRPADKAWIGDSISVYFSELPDAAQAAIEAALAHELRGYIESFSDRSERDYI